MQNEMINSEETLLPERIAGLLLPMAGCKLLAPVTAIAEVVNVVPQVERVADGGLLYGWIEWRNQRIPLASFECARGETPPQLESHSPAVVFNAIGGLKGTGFYAVLLQNLPTPAQVIPQQLEENSGSQQRLELARGTIGDENIAVADLGQLEKLIAAAIG